MRRLFVLFIAFISVSSCAWIKTEPKVEPSPTEEEMRLAELERKLEEAEVLVGQGITHYQNGKDSMAVKSWDQALAIIPDDAEVHNFKGMALHRMGKISEAKKEFEAALLINPAYYQAYNNAGYMWFLLNNYDRAEAAFVQALKLKPDYKDAQDNIKLLDQVIDGKLSKKVFELNEEASNKVDHDDQIIEYKKVLALDSTYAKAHNNLAVAYYYSDNMDSSLVHLKKAVALKKDYPEAINNLGYLYKVAENYEVAIKFFLKALTLKPKYIGALNNLAETYYLNNELSNAHRTLNTVLDLEPGNPVAKRWLIKVETKEAE